MAGSRERGRSRPWHGSRILTAEGRIVEAQSAGPLVLLLILLAGCAPSGLVEDEVLGVLREQQVAWNRGDLDAFLEAYQRSASTTFSSASGTRRGWDDLRQRYLEIYPDREAMGQLEFSELQVVSLGKGGALVTGRWQLERKDDAPAGVFSVIFRPFVGGWKIIHDHTSAFPTGDE
ncbi:MAG: DUF4440 domain-containing protein [Planctomycetota bacterium]|nr:DUF4440 domain-containing protein [Planctomycetota bacterium]